MALLIGGSAQSLLSFLDRQKNETSYELCWVELHYATKNTIIIWSGLSYIEIEIHIYLHRKDSC